MSVRIKQKLETVIIFIAPGGQILQLLLYSTHSWIGINFLVIAFNEQNRNWHLDAHV